MLMVSVVIIATWQGFQVGSDIWLSRWTSDNAVHVGHNLEVYALLGLGASVFLLLRSLVMASTGVQAAQRLYHAMTESLLAVPLRFFDVNPIGRVLNRYAEDLSTVDFRLPFAVFRLLVATAVNMAQIFAAVYAIQWSGVLILPLAWLYLQLGFFYLATFREATRLTKTTRSPVLSHLSQCEDGVTILRAYGPAYTQRAIEESYRKNDAFNRAWYAKAVVTQWFAVRVQMIGFSVVVLVVATLVVLHEWLSPGLVGLAFMYAVSIDIRLSWWIDSWSSLEMAMVSAERIVAYTEIEPEEDEQRIVRSTTARAHWPQRGTITFDSVQFAYKPGGDLVLKGLSFEVHHNEKIGIVGRTGAGKSSLTMALFRINELQCGRILLDGVDISTIQLQSFRSKMSIIPQVPVLFKGPLRAYMDPFDEYSDVEIWTAFDKMSMKAMVGGLEGKLQYELSENGENFSVGERQLLCLARALLRKSRVVVMDEATASIDRTTEKKLQEMIQREFVDATVLTIAHRLATVLESDRILVLSDGRVAEFDTPKQLVRVKGGIFRELAKEGGYLAELEK